MSIPTYPRVRGCLAGVFVGVPPLSQPKRHSHDKPARTKAYCRHGECRAHWLALWGAGNDLLVQLRQALTWWLR